MKRRMPCLHSLDSGGAYWSDKMSGEIARYWSSLPVWEPANGGLGIVFNNASLDMDGTVYKSYVPCVL